MVRGAFPPKILTWSLLYSVFISRAKPGASARVSMHALHKIQISWISESPKCFVLYYALNIFIIESNINSGDEGIRIREWDVSLHIWKFGLTFLFLRDGFACRVLIRLLFTVCSNTDSHLLNITFGFFLQDSSRLNVLNASIDTTDIFPGTSCTLIWHGKQTRHIFPHQLWNTWSFQM